MLIIKYLTNNNGEEENEYDMKDNLNISMCIKVKIASRDALIIDEMTPGGDDLFAADSWNMMSGSLAPILPQVM